MDRLEQARTAERLQQWDVAIALVSARAECYSDDPDAHDNHLWHMDLLARAGRLPELAERALTDVHARRSLNRSLGEQGRDAALRTRVENGDLGALYVLVRLLCGTNRMQEAWRAVQDIAPKNEYAHRIVAGARRP
ncbi:hypothetical protein [Streptomyces sp. MJP52]|uniref:hypothetical protein n=1 Tax=Streptomyces sp. MJP52 TaxID=2940555 RepID=UPI0024757C0D|nr:hypothetical protein [Streptomyces sp. MJP52]MDH6229226.1 hypothetical protein [Streptomyces sp. MJP52]